MVKNTRAVLCRKVTGFLVVNRLALLKTFCSVKNLTGGGIWRAGYVCGNARKFDGKVFIIKF